MTRVLAKFLFYAVAIILLIWTSSLTYSFLSMALPNTFWAVPLLGLVVFDVGMISWMFVFLGHAEGAIQRAVAIALTMFNFVGVGLMVIAEILLDGQQLVEAPEMLGTAAIWGIGIWTIANVLGVLIFHLGSPAARREMAMQTEKDALHEGALKHMRAGRTARQTELAGAMGDILLEELIASLDTKTDDDGGKTARAVRDALRHNNTEVADKAPAGQGQPSANGHTRDGANF